MAGLNLNGSMGLRMSMPTHSAPSTASEAAFGTQYVNAGTPSTTRALAPNDPFGVTFWTGIGALALLLLIRHSLPS